jgi:hypothetical protein
MNSIKPLSVGAPHRVRARHEDPAPEDGAHAQRGWDGLPLSQKVLRHSATDSQSPHDGDARGMDDAQTGEGQRKLDRAKPVTTSQRWARRSMRTLSAKARWSYPLKM